MAPARAGPSWASSLFGLAHFLVGSLFFPNLIDDLGTIITFLEVFLKGFEEDILYYQTHKPARNIYSFFNRTSP